MRQSLARLKSATRLGLGRVPYSGYRCSPMEAGDEPKDVTSNEEKELRRVYDHLANFSPKYKLRKRMQPLLDRKQKIMQFKRNPDAIRIVDEAGVELTPDQLEKELEHIEGEIDTLKIQIDEIDADPTKKIHCVDLMDALHSLGKDSTKVGAVFFFPDTLHVRR